MTGEKRDQTRKRTLKGGRIAFNDGHSTLECTVRNLSGGGARLVVESTIGLPDAFLLMLEDGGRHQCTVRWRKLTELGVMFAE